MSETIKCPYCGSEKLVRNPEGFLVCVNCGSVIEHSNITAEELYNVRKNVTKREIETPLSWTAPLNIPKKHYLIEPIISEKWKQFVELVKQRSSQLLQYINEFEKWFYTEGIKVLLYKAHKTQEHGCNYLAKQWLYGQLKHCGERILLNLFAMWLHVHKRFSLYSLKHKYKLITNYEGVYSWLRCYKRKLEKMSRSK